MAFIVKTLKTLRNHWKKSTFAAIVVVYGVSYTKNYIATQNLMRVYCEKAAKYGNDTIPVTDSPRHITVILNPNANKRKSTDEFDKYCAPLLHLAGISVEIIKTESEGHAKTLSENLTGAEAVVVAGGDGTLADVVTGLLRRTNENTAGLVPIGVLPLGKINSVAKTFFPGGKKLEKVKSLADATMAVVEEATRPVDVMKIEVLDDGETRKPVYAVGEFKWGAFRDAEVKKDSYWYFGGFRKYATYVFNGIKSNLNWNCEALVTYNPPCNGCSNCYQVKTTKPSSKWFQRFIKEDNSHAQYLSINNPECQKRTEKKISTIDFTLFTSNVIPSSLQEIDTPRLHLNIGPSNVDYLEFVKQGWQTEQGKKRTAQESIEARTIDIVPEDTKKESWFSIDNETYEAKPVRVTLLPKIINMYCRKEVN